ncbi:MAG TPA: NAD(+)/NADH kinase [Baekduia sp.]|nr:NAD(+)/NADH kinase [Baekduia sp.]
MKTVTVLTHGRPDELDVALAALRIAAEKAGVTVQVSPEEIGEHGKGLAERLDLNDPLKDDVELCFAFGGDGTILRALRRYAGTNVPVFGVNFGEVGFLATIEPSEVSHGFDAAFAGDFDVLSLPAISFRTEKNVFAAINDISIHRRPGQRVAELAYVVDGVTVGSIRCDGLVAATPVGSTGYNLANGGPLLAWGVEGFVVTFIAPHSLTARPLVVAPGDTLEIVNRSRGEVDIAVDGRPAGETLHPGQSIFAHWVAEAGHLAQPQGSTFYARVRERFGRLAV